MWRSLGRKWVLSTFLHLSLLPSTLLSFSAFFSLSLLPIFPLHPSPLFSAAHILVDSWELRPDIHAFCPPSCLFQKPGCLSFHRKAYFPLSETVRRGCWASIGPDSNYNGPIASCTDITSDLFKPFSLMITFSIQDKNICSFWVREQPDYSFIRKWCRSLLQSNWLTGFGIRKCKSLTVFVALLLSQWNPQLSKWMVMWSG